MLMTKERRPAIRTLRDGRYRLALGLGVVAHAPDIVAEQRKRQVAGTP